MNHTSVPRHQLSKSTFMYGVQCAKRVWLHKNLPKERDDQTAFQRSIFQQGTDVGKLAQDIFPGGINAEPENYYSYQKSVADTLRFIRNGHQIIYEASFQYNGILCAVDILLKENNKWYAYEVKSTTSLKSAHVYDAALQYFVITNAGIDLVDISIIHLNKNYVRQGALEIQKLFQPISVLKNVLELYPFINSKSAELLDVLSKNMPPEKEIGEHCQIPYPCDFQKFCNKGVLPVKGQEDGAAMNKNEFTEVVGALNYPLYFLSLETWMSAVPLFDGHWPYKQVCFQYSMHVQTAPGAPLAYYYFLAEEMNNKQGKLIESLLREAGEEGCIIVHRDSFVKFHLRELKKEFAYLDKQISSLQKRIVELPAPFWKDFNLEEIMERNFKMGADIAPVSGELVISDHSSASAAYFNLRRENDLFNQMVVKSALLSYGKKSSLEMATVIGRCTSVSD